jgi:hypothetical protein
MPLHLSAATLLLCLRGATGLHARPATPLSPRRLSRVRSAVPVCAEDGADSDEMAKARRRRDEQALQAEWRDGLAPNAKVSLGPNLRHRLRLGLRLGLQLRFALTSPALHRARSATARCGRRSQRRS